jgi:hypothetical protein
MLDAHHCDDPVVDLVEHPVCAATCRPETDQVLTKLVADPVWVLA